MGLSPAAPLRLSVEDGLSVAGLLLLPAQAHACCVLAHGAGAGMAHPFMDAVSRGLEARRIATLRFQFPYIERGSRRPDPPAVAHASVRAAVAEAARRCPGLPLVAAGKSYGGRMASQAQAVAPLPGVRGLAFLGFPLHPAGRPSDARAAHLFDVRLPMLFLQGTRDALADPALMAGVTARLGERATLEWFDQADHSFHVPARSGRRDAEVLEDLLDRLAVWVGDVCS